MRALALRRGPNVGCFLIGLLCLPTRAHAQDEVRRGFIGVGFGPSSAFGSFADRSTANPRAGFASSGLTQTYLDVWYLPGVHLGIAAFATASDLTMERGIEEAYWNVSTLTIGPMYVFPLGRRGALDLKATAGLLTLTPEIESFVIGPDPDQSRGSSVGIDLRASLRYDVFRKWAVFAEAGVQSANVHHREAGTRTDVRIIVSSFGIAYRLRW